MRARHIDVEQLDDLLTQFSVQYFVVDAEGAFLTATRCDAAAPTPANIFEAYGAEPHAVAELRRLLAGSEIAFRVKIGPVAYEVRAKPIRDEHGRLDGAMGIAKVVTEELQLREQLVESEARLRQIFDSDVIGMLFWDRNGKITAANDAFLEMVGHSRRDLDEGRLDWSSMTPPEHAALDRVALEEIDERGHCAPFEKEYIRKDGHRVPVLIAGASLDSEHSRGIAFVLDESRRKAEERQRRAAEEQLRHAVDQAPFILWAVDMNGVFTLAEGQGLAAIGRKRGEAVGHSAFELYEDLPDVVVSLRRGLAGEAFSYVSNVRGRVFETRTFPLRDSGGGMAGFSAVSLDVTERQRAELERVKMQTQLLEGQKLESLGLLAGGIAHDFNNILTVILGCASSASMRLPADNPAREDIENITAAARRAADLTHQMLAYSGKAHFEIRPIDLSQHVREITTLLEMTVSKKATLRLSVARDLPAILADSAQIQQVIMNLVLNAAEAIGNRSGTVLVTTGVEQVAQADLEAWCAESLSPGQYVFVEVRDSGAGMDAATQARIFDPFFTTKFAGRGLGLSAVLGIVRAHKGGIKVESSSGVGSTFRIIFPSAGPKPFRHDPAPSPYRGRGLALVIDDDPGVRRVVREMLGRLGFSVVEAANGRQGLELFRERLRSVAVVVVDMTMPEMGGEETFREIREISDVPVVLMSGFTEVDATHCFTFKPFAAFLHKPFTQQELSQKLKLVFEENARAESSSPDARRPGR